MALILELIAQGVPMTIVLALAPLVTGLVRQLKARLLRRRGPPLLQPYRDILRLLRKDALVAHNASWLFRAAPYLIFAVTWIAAALVPTYATGLIFSWSVDLIAIVALLGTARFAQALAGTTQLSGIAEHVLSSEVGLRVSLGLALVALIMVAIAENGRIPIDNPATHLELTMVHEAMVLEYSGRHLALIEAAQSLRLLLYLSLIACEFVPFGMAAGERGFAAVLIGLVSWVGKVGLLALLLAVFETSIAKMRVFRVGEFLGGALMLGFLGTLLLFVSRGM